MTFPVNEFNNTPFKLSAVVMAAAPFSSSMVLRVHLAFVLLSASVFIRSYSLILANAWSK